MHSITDISHLFDSTLVDTCKLLMPFFSAWYFCFVLLFHHPTLNTLDWHCMSPITKLLFSCTCKMLKFPCHSTQQQQFFFHHTRFLCFSIIYPPLFTECLQKLHNAIKTHSRKFSTNNAREKFTIIAAVLFFLLPLPSSTENTINNNNDSQLQLKSTTCRRIWILHWQLCVLGYNGWAMSTNDAWKEWKNYMKSQFQKFALKISLLHILADAPESFPHHPYSCRVSNTQRRLILNTWEKNVLVKSHMLCRGLGIGDGKLLFFSTLDKQGRLE